RRPDEADARPQPELRPAQRLVVGAREPPERVPVHGRLELERHPEQDRRGPARRRDLEHPGARTWYLTMNLTQPPFDDVHVRKAMNWVMDKTALVQAWGGPAIGKVAN